MREVLISKRIVTTRGTGTVVDTVKDGRGWFHGWGTNFEELRDGVGQFSTAIIEREDGRIDNVPAELVQFVLNVVEKKARVR